MTTNYVDFCNAYQEMIKISNENNNDSYRKGVSFTVEQHSYSMFSYSKTLFTLDEEDLRYLYDKYSKKLLEELEHNIQEIKSKYPL